MSPCFGIVPAAGHSRRMGTNKLLLPWAGSTIIQTVVRAWQRSTVHRVIVVLRKGDTQSQTLVTELDVDVVLPEHDPEDMKQSVQFALEYIQNSYRPTRDNGWLLAPVDLPTLRTETINQLVAAFVSQPEDVPRKIVVPHDGQKRGHPVVFPFAAMDDVFRLQESEGINALLSRNEIVNLPMHNVDFDDVDTPSDYQRAVEAEEKRDANSDVVGNQEQS